jgi:hypothetical protein
MPIATGREGARSALRGFKVVCAGIPESFWDPSVSCGLPSLQHVHNITISQGRSVGHCRMCANAFLNPHLDSGASNPAPCDKSSWRSRAAILHHMLCDSLTTL